MYLSQIGEYFSQLQNVKTPQHVVDLMRSMVFDESIAGAFIANLPERGRDLEPHIIVRGWNHDWISYYTKNGYVEHDPIAKELVTTNLPFVWDDVCRSRNLRPIENKIMRQACSAGLAHGVTIPILDISNSTTCVSFCSTYAVRNREHIEYLRQVAYMTVARLNKFNPLRRSPQQTTPLTRRQLDCLARVARGMSSRLIANEIGISTRTVDMYIATAMQRLQAATRAQAVQIALNQRVIPCNSTVIGVPKVW